MYTPRINWVLFSFFCLATIGVFAAAIASPPFREVAYAPLREMLIPSPAPVVISVLYSTEKEGWLNEVIIDLECANPTIEGHPIKVELEKIGPGKSMPLYWMAPASLMQFIQKLDDHDRLRIDLFNDRLQH